MVRQNNSQRLGKETGRLRNLRASGYHPDYSIGQNTGNSPGNLKSLAVTQTLVKDYQLTPVRKTLK